MTQRDGIGWVMAGQIHDDPARGPAGAMLEVAYGQALAELRRDRERLERWLKSNKRSNQIINEVFGEDKYAMPTTPEEFDAYMQSLDAATEEGR